jgi:hypothetical protein
MLCRREQGKRAEAGVGRGVCARWGCNCAAQAFLPVQAFLNMTVEISFSMFEGEKKTKRG